MIFLRSQKKRSPASVLYAAAACFSAVILVWSGVLAGIAGTAVSLIVFLPAVLGMNRKKSLGWYGTAVLLVALSLTSVYFFPSDGGARSGGDRNAAVRQVEELQQALHGDLSDSAGSGRIHIYRQVWHLIEAVSYTHLDHAKGFSLLECRLETGRTHQIRVHMAYIHHPLLGDPVYGPKKTVYGADTQMLHAGTLGFLHPVTGEYLEFHREPPEEFRKICEKIGLTLPSAEEHGETFRTE